MCPDPFLTLTCRTGIAEPAMLWIDTYFEWINPRSKCCGITEGGDFCHYPQYGNATCKRCVTQAQLGDNDWPKPQDFQKFLPWFLEDNPGTRCPSGGHAAFAGGVKVNPDGRSVNSKFPWVNLLVGNFTFFLPILLPFVPPSILCHDLP